MLKIKDNVDLKELFNYGFYDALGIYQKVLEVTSDGVLWNDINICVEKTTRLIRFSNRIERDTYNLDCLYDLIKDDLIEKVEN